jgi:hypothetical protein
VLLHEIDCAKTERENTTLQMQAKITVLPACLGRCFPRLAGFSQSFLPQAAPTKQGQLRRFRSKGVQPVKDQDLCPRFVRREITSIQEWACKCRVSCVRSSPQAKTEGVVIPMQTRRKRPTSGPFVTLMVVNMTEAPSDCHSDSFGSLGSISPQPAAPSSAGFVAV